MSMADRDHLKIFHGRSGVDLAIVSVPVASTRTLGTTVPSSFDRLGDIRGLKSGAPVRPVGCPQGACGEAPPDPDRVMWIDRQGVLFQSSFVTESGARVPSISNRRPASKQA